MAWKWIALLALGAVTPALTPALAQPAQQAPNTDRCFSVTEFQNWSAADARTMYVRVTRNRFYRLDLGGQCPNLIAPNPRLHTTFRGTGLICSGLDWDLKVDSGIGSFSEPCIVKTQTPLTPQEAAALPAKFRP